MPECAKTHLQQSRISKFSGGGPPDPLFKGRGGKGKRGEWKGKGRREGKDREGKGGTGRDRGGKEGGKGGMGAGVVGRGEEGGSIWAPPPPPRDKLWIRPWLSFCWLTAIDDHAPLTAK